jgi:hypothetical protein
VNTGPHANGASTRMLSALTRQTNTRVGTS